MPTGVRKSRRAVTERHEPDEGMLTREHIRRRILGRIERARLFEGSPTEVKSPFALHPPSGPGNLTFLARLKEAVRRLPILGKLAVWGGRLVLLPARFYRLQDLFVSAAGDLRSSISLQEAAAHRNERKLEEITAAQGGIGSRLDDLEGQVRDYGNVHAEDLAGLRGRLDGAEGQLSRVRTEVLGEGLAPWPPFLTGPFDPTFPDGFDAALHPLLEEGRPAQDRLYLALEAALRGTESDIAGRQAAYLPLIAERFGVPDLPILDVGCGRGEFLELVRARGWKATGVDVNSIHIEMLAGRGLDVREQGAVEYLRSIPDASLAGVTAFQVAEHFAYDYLSEFVGLCARKLRTGGFLLIETPNPYCLEVFRTFYSDPTHNRPLPPHYLGVLLRFYGFGRLTIIYQSPVPGGLAGGDAASKYMTFALIGTKT